MRVTEDEARALDKPYKGIRVSSHKGTWSYFARFQINNRQYCRYAGKNLERAIALRAELETQFLRKNDNAAKPTAERT